MHPPKGMGPPGEMDKMSGKRRLPGIEADIVSGPRRYEFQQVRLLSIT